ncbi:MAG: BamA/TamA family outer membrane protein [Planctomycetota bacterium]
MSGPSTMARVGALCACATLMAACRSTDGARTTPAPAARPLERVVTRDFGALELRITGMPRDLERVIDRATGELMRRYEESNGAEAYLDDAAFELELALRVAGHPRALVEYRTIWDGGQQVAELIVDAGPRVLIGEVQIAGLAGTPMDAREVRGALGEPERGLLGGQGEWRYDQDRARRAPDRLQRSLEAVGYLDARVSIEAPDLDDVVASASGDASGAAAPQRITVHVTVSAGARYRLAGVELSFDDEVEGGDEDGAGPEDASRLDGVEPGAAPQSVTEAEGPVTEAEGPVTEAEGPVTEAEGPATEAEGPVTEAEGRAVVALRAACAGIAQSVEGASAERPRAFEPRLGTVLYGRLVEELGRRGYPDAVVSVEPRIDAARARVRLVADVKRGPHVSISAVRFEGAERTRRSFLASRVAATAGRVYDASAARADVRQLYRTGLFREVASKLVGEGTERELVFELVERSSREAWIEPGYGSYELLRASAGLRERNLFGTGRAWRAEGTAALRALRLSSTLTDPWLLGHDLIGDLRVEYDRRDEPSFVRLQRGVGLFVTKEWSASQASSVGYQLRRSEVRNVTVVDAVLEDDPDVIDLSSVRFTHRIDLRDDAFVPSSGTFTELAFEYGSTALGSELDFYRASVTLSGYHALGAEDVLAASFRTGVVIPFGNDDSIPLQERYFSGGENSVRSFSESALGPKDRAGEPIGGEGYFTLGVEWRHALTQRLQGALFADAGQLSLDYQDTYELSDLRSGVGLGLRYLLPIGPLRVDAAVNPDPAGGEDTWAAHFSIGMAF